MALHQAPPSEKVGREVPDEVVEKIEKEEEMKVSDFRLPQFSLAFLSDPGQHQPGKEFVKLSR